MRISIAVLVLLSTVAAGCRHGDEEDVPPVVAVRVVRAVVVNVPLTVEAPAAIFGKAQANISSRITAPVRRLNERENLCVPECQRSCLAWFW